MTKKERKTAAIQQRTIEHLLVVIEAKYRTWQELMNATISHVPTLDIRNEYDDLMDQGERGREIANSWDWALTFASA